MTPPPIETTTPQERRGWIRREFPCISCCENCGVTSPGDIKDNAKLKEAYEMGRGIE